MNRALLALSILISPHVLATPADAAATANGPLCAAQAPFYWEIGTSQGVTVSGSVKAGRSSYDRESLMPIASASKWPYGAYVNEIRAGNLTPDDLKFLTFKSGYTRFSQCDKSATVGSCAAGARFVKRSEGKFSYSGGHMQKHAATFMPGMTAMNNETLASAMNATLGTTFAYTQPQLAGGINATPATYAHFLKSVMADKLIDGKYLSSDVVPTQGSQALTSPVPEPWSYGRGHWIEQDGTASSPGAFGFYPWISADKKLYGIVSRYNISPGAAWDSVLCGREIRKAFLK